MANQGKLISDVKRLDQSLPSFSDRSCRAIKCSLKLDWGKSPGAKWMQVLINYLGLTLKMPIRDAPSAIVIGPEFSRRIATHCRV